MTFIEATQALARKLKNVAEKREKLDKILEIIATQKARRDGLEILLITNANSNLRFDAAHNSDLVDEMVNHLDDQIKDLDAEEKRLRGELLDLCDGEQ